MGLWRAVSVSPTPAVAPLRVSSIPQDHSELKQRTHVFARPFLGIGYVFPLALRSSHDPFARVDQHEALGLYGPSSPCNISSWPVMRVGQSSAGFGFVWVEGVERKRRTVLSPRDGKGRGLKNMWGPRAFKRSERKC